MALTEPSGTARSRRPARRRPGRRHGATTSSVGTTKRLPDAPSVSLLSRRPITECRQVHAAVSKNEGVA